MNVTPHLRVYSHFDFLKSIINPEIYLKFLQDQQIKIAPLLGNKTVFGLFDFALKAESKGIKPILGLTLPEILIGNHTCEITLYARNYQGYENICSISSQFLQNSEQKINLLEITKFLPNLKIVLSLTKHTTLEQLQQTILKFKNWETQLYGGIAEPDLNPTIFQTIFPEEKMLIFYPIRYLKEEEKTTYEIVFQIREPNQEKTNLVAHHYLTTSTIKKNNLHTSFLSNWKKFVDNIALNFHQQNFKLLKSFRFDKNKNSKKLLHELCETALQEKFSNADIYQERYKYELKIIEKYGFIDYFLIVWDYVNFAYQKNILVGTGRGSASGSLISYLLQITKIDPIKNELMFERFLNPERIDLPDIDLDFEDERRSEVMKYIFDKYGENHAAMVATFQKMGARLAVRDIGRVMKISLGEIDEISKAIPLKFNNDWKKAIENSLILQKYQKKYPELFTQTSFLIGLPRQSGVHAAGIVISNYDLSKLTGTWIDNEGNTVVQLDMTNLSDVGLMKMDILGLRNLTLISNLLDKIGITENKNAYLQKINFNDAKVYSFLEKGETTGIFQLSSPGMTNLLKQMKPKNIADIAITISLFRPGPMQNIKAFLERKKYPEKISYFYAGFESILKNTMGFPIFQEQIIQMIGKFTHFNYAKSDIFRKAISKKDQNLSNEFKKTFFMGAKQEQHSLVLTTQVWEFLEKFASYGFNRSHALAYAYISYLMSYFKYYYFEHFMILLLNSVTGDETKTKIYLSELTQHKIVLLSPSINTKTIGYEKVKAGVRLSLLSIKKVGKNWAQKINKEREANGDFKDIFDFVARMLRFGLNEMIYQQLVYGGAFHIWKYNQKTLIQNWKRILLIAKIVSVKEQAIDWTLLNEKPSLIEYKSDASQEWINQYKVFGFVWEYQKLQVFATQSQCSQEQDLFSLKNVQKIHKIQDFYVTFICETVKTVVSKKNEQMAFAKVSDATDVIEIAIFSNLWTTITFTPGKFFCAIIRNQKHQNKMKYFLVKILKQL